MKRYVRVKVDVTLELGVDLHPTETDWCLLSASITDDPGLDLAEVRTALEKQSSFERDQAGHGFDVFNDLCVEAGERVHFDSGLGMFGNGEPEGPVCGADNPRLVMGNVAGWAWGCNEKSICKECKAHVDDVLRRHREPYDASEPAGRADEQEAGA